MERLAQPVAPTSMRRQGLRQAQQGEQRRHADGRQQPEDEGPTGETQDLAADERADQGRDGHNSDERRHHLRRPRAGIEIAHHRP